MKAIVSSLVLVLGMTAQADNQTKEIRIQNYQAALNSAASLRIDPNHRQMFVVQFKGSVNAKLKQSLSKQGISVYKYIPEDALIVEATQNLIEGIKPLLNTYVAYTADFKRSENLEANSIFNREQSQNLTVTLFSENKVNSTLEKISNSESFQVLSVNGRFINVVTTPQGEAFLLNEDAVEYVEPMAEMQTMYMDLNSDNPARDTLAVEAELNGFETGTKVMNFSSAWDKSFTGKNQIVAVADTGLDSGDLTTIHQDFKGAVKQGLIVGIGGKSWGDPMGHGTHVAGSVLGRGTAKGGLLKGGAYGASLVMEGMWSDIMDNLMVPKLSDLFSQAKNAGATVHSNSWGSAKNFGVYDSMASQVDDFMFKNQDMLIVFAAGNNGVDKDKNGVIDSDSISSPGVAKNCLTVGASENLLDTGGIQKQVKDLKNAAESWGAEPIFSSKVSDNANGIAIFSSRGPTKDGRTKPEVVAPGTNILSVRSQNPKAGVLWGEYNKDYVYSGGTSMATPLVSGAATVIRQYIQEKLNIAKPSGALLKAAVIASTQDLFPGQYGEGSPTQELKTKRPNFDEGFGKVDLGQTVSNLEFQGFDSSVGEGQSVEFKFEVKSAAHLTAVLSYFDAPAAAAATVTLVNNLDLQLVNSKGEAVRLNDAKNNSEMIESQVDAGTYTLKVTGVKVPTGIQGKQPFGLVYKLN